MSEKKKTIIKSKHTYYRDIDFNERKSKRSKFTLKQPKMFKEVRQKKSGTILSSLNTCPKYRTYDISTNKSFSIFIGGRFRC